MSCSLHSCCCKRLVKCSPFSRGDFHFPYGEGAIRRAETDDDQKKERTHTIKECGEGMNRRGDEVALPAEHWFTRKRR